MDLATLSTILEVSPSTISRVLNNHPSQSITKKRREFIIQGAAKHGYRPNFAARSLAKQKSLNIGWLLHKDVKPSSMVNYGPLMEYMSSVDIELQKHHYGLRTMFISRERSIYDFSQLLKEQQFDAVIFSMSIGERQMLDFVGGVSIPYAVIKDKKASDWPGNYFDVDEVADAKIIIEHLLSLGHERIGVADWDSRGRLASETMSRHVVSILREKGLEANEDWIVTVDPEHDPFYSELEFGREAVRDLLSLKRRPTAVICATDMIGMGVISGAGKAGIEIGRDLAVTGNGNFEAGSVAEGREPVLTTLMESCRGMARAVVDVLIAQIDNPKTQCRRELFASKLIVRKSTSPLAIIEN